MLRAPPWLLLAQPLLLLPFPLPHLHKPRSLPVLHADLTLATAPLLSSPLPRGKMMLERLSRLLWPTWGSGR